MLRFIVSRLSESIVVLLIGSILCFAFIRMLPGSPAAAMYGDQLQKMSKADQIRIAENLGLDEPIYTQYAKWFMGVLQGDWGRSYNTGEEVKMMIAHAVEPTIILMLAAAVITIVLSLFLGVITGLRRYSFFDHAVTVASFIFMSLPSFWFALMLMLFFSVYLGVLPTSGMGQGGIGDWLKHLIMPAFILGLSHIGYYIRILRNHIAVTQEKEFVWALQARGISKRTILWKHIFPNASIPYLSFMGMSLSLSLAGSVVVETLFSWPGLGRLSLKAALAHDYPVLLAAILLSMSIVIIGSFMVDLICAWIDPRLRRHLLKEEGR
ncbi:ABC transporter permease [Peribacillus huizhouensis]|uniref:Peptide/nickel transport system permease protein n=1 Tax=Peribacillus huizhouensis TaxID=1501239 RepID=A0ABR6CP79_9BACI|nr:ABC transporter permease [Peribacillus huizhouensis]MBA9026842.1 peptide/nickel transport system permease protein [Peribacillus huizhouensis]